MRNSWKRTRSCERKYRKKKGPLLVVSKECELIKSGSNIPGVDVAIVDKLNAESLAPGAVPGRLTIFTSAAIERLGAEQLFTRNPRKRENKEEPKKKVSPKKKQRGKKPKN